MKTALITTTIHVPEAIDGYLANFAKNGHRDVEVVVIGDNKSPAETGDYLAGLAERTGYTIHWWDVARQKEWLKDLPELDQLLPYNSVQRRNLAYLQAVLIGAERIITVDDDNHATDDDFIGGHEVVGQCAAVPVVSSSSSRVTASTRLR